MLSQRPKLSVARLGAPMNCAPVKPARAMASANDMPNTFTRGHTAALTYGVKRNGKLERRRRTVFVMGL